MAMTEDRFLCPADIVRRCVGLAVDIGGSVVKMVYRSNVTASEEQQGDYGPLHIITCSREELTSDILQQLRPRIHLSSESERSTVYLCGLGDQAIEEQIRTIFNVDLVKVMEMDSLIDALTMILERFPKRHLFHEEGSVTELDDLTMLESTPDLYPYMLLNFGTTFGYNIISKDVPPKLMSLSSNGGRHFMGLSSVLLGIKSHKELIELAQRGNKKTVELYTESNRSVGLNSMDECLDPPLSNLCREDLALYLYKMHIRGAVREIYRQCEVNNIKHFFMAGNFASHSLVRQLFIEELQITQQFMFADKEKKNAPCLYFLKLSGHLCAFGTLLKSL